MKKKKRAVDELRELAGDNGSKKVDALGKKWTAECLAEARTAAKNGRHSADVSVREVEARSYVGSYDMFQSRNLLCASRTVRRLKREEGLDASFSFQKIDAYTLTGGMFGEETRDYPETYKLVIKIRW